MKIGIEMMVQTIFLCISCVILAQIIGSNLYMLQARTCFHKLADQIECSQNDEAVIEQCKEEAKAQGYRLESQQIDTEQGDSCILLSLYYKMQVPGLGKHGNSENSENSDEQGSLEGVIQGYAR